MHAPIRTEVSMATHTLIAPRHVETDELPVHGAKALRYVVPVGRVLFSLPFIASGLGHIMGRGVQQAAEHGIPAASAAVPIAGVLALVGGLSIFLGWKARIGALLLMLFLVPVTLTLHRFWGLDDAQAAMMQYAHFLKNVSIFGGTLVFAYFGAGPISFDARHAATS
jgi:putative oxidoreductase